MRKVLKINRMWFAFFALLFVLFFLIKGNFIYPDLAQKTYVLQMSGNMSDVNFGQLVHNIALATGSDDERLLKFGGPFMLTIDQNKNIEKFNFGFIVFRKNRSIHFQAKYQKENELLVKRSWDVELEPDEVYDYRDFGVTLKLLDKIPWKHVSENISINNSYLGITDFITGDGQGNFRVDVPKSFIMKRDGQIIQINGEELIPENQYQVIGFIPRASGKIEVQYFVEI